MAHPHGIFLADLPHALEERAFSVNLDFRATELGMMPALDLTAKLRRHGLLAVADAEDRKACLEQLFGSARRRIGCHRFRAAGEDHAFRLHGPNGFSRFLKRDYLRINTIFTHPAGDQLGYLRAEVHNEYLVVRLGHFISRQVGGQISGWGLHRCFTFNPAEVSCPLMGLSCCVTGL
jgi:hypothetical protein